MWIVRLALRRPYTVATMCLLIFLMAILSIRKMPVDIFPAIDIPVVVVVWNYNGLSAQEMERRIVYVTERALSTTVNGITHIESESISGIGVLRIYFEPGTEIGSSIAQITSTCNGITRVMPPGITAPAILQFNASNVPVAQITATSDRMSERELYDYSFNFVRLKLFTIPGLSTPAPYGGANRQVSVDIDPVRLAAKGLSPQDVVLALQQSNVILPAGSARIGTREYDVQINGSPVRAEDFNSIPIKVINGVPVNLGDVAHVHDGFAVQQNIVRIDGRRATYMAILKKANASTLAVVDAAREMLPAIRAAAPQGMELRLDFDQSVFVRASVKGVLREGAAAAALVSLMVFFFLGSWRSMLIVIASIPLAILVGVVGLMLTGNTLNVMTLGGLALAIGMLVDDATVEVENIHRNRSMGKPMTVAILDGARQIAVPALAATLTICIVFFPVVLLTGPARYLFTPLAISVVIPMLASYLLSRTLVPTMARMLMGRDPVHHNEPQSPQDDRGLLARFNRWRDRRFESVRDRYSRILEVALHHRVYVTVIATLLAVSAGVLAFHVGVDFFPVVDAGQMRMHFRAPVGTRIEETELLVAKAEDRIRHLIPADELQTINANIGVPAYYNLAFVPSDNIGGQDADIFISLKPKHRPTAEYMRAIRADLPSSLPGVALYFQPADIVSQVLNFGVPSAIDIQITGREVDANFDLAREMLGRVKTVSGTADVRVAQVFHHPAIAVDVDRQRAAQLGLTERDVATSLLTSLSSSFLLAPSFWVNPQNFVNYTVAVQTPLPLMRSMNDLMSTPVSLAPGGVSSNPAPIAGMIGGAAPPLQPGFQAQSTTLATVSTARASDDRALINHYDVQPSIDVLCSADGRDLGSVTSDIHRVISEFKQLPRGTQITVRGQSESMMTSFKSLALGLVVAIALVYLLLVVLFQSWLDPFIIMAAVPGALVGILWMLAASGTTLNVESLMGAIMAVGIAVSNSILLVNFANDVRAERGVDAIQAALEAGHTRLRPVIMTALAMILGMIPMALGLGEGGEQNAPLGRAVIGGLLVATFVTLLVVPVVYSLLRKAPPRGHELDERFESEAKGAET